MNNIEQTSNGLVGQFFHSIDEGKIGWQGFVVSAPQAGWYLIQLFSWLTGEPSVRRLVRFEEMESWLFYEDAEVMNFSYESGTASHYPKK